MVKEWFEDLALNLSQKVRSNILGAIIIVWTFRNWELMYALFYFTDDWTLLNRIEWIKKYFPGYSFYGDLGWTVLKAFGLVIVTYFLKAGGIYISRFYEYKIKKFVLEKISPGELIPIKEYNILDTKLKRSETRASEELQKRQDAEERAEKLEKELLAEKQKTLGKAADEIDSQKLINETKANEDELELEKITSDEILEEMIDNKIAETNETKEVYENDNVGSINVLEDGRIDNILDTIDINKWEKVTRQVLRESTNGAIFSSNHPIIKFLNDKEILNQLEHHKEKDFHYELTDWGQMVKKRFYQKYGLGEIDDKTNEKLNKIKNEEEVTKVRTTYDIIRKKELLSTLKFILESIGSEEPLTMSHASTKFFITLDIIKRNSDIHNGDATYILTELGQKIKDIYLTEDY